VPPTPAMSIWVSGSGNYTGNVAYVETKPYQTTWVNITIGRLSSDIAARVTNALTGANLSGVTLIAAWYFGSDVQTTDVSGSAPQTVRAMEYGYAGSQATLNPSPGDGLWLNLTLAADNSPPSIRSFTATPSTGLDPAHLTALAADIGEASLDLSTISILMMSS